MRRATLVVVVAMMLLVPVATTSCSAMSPIGSLLMLGAAGYFAYDMFDDATNCELTVINSTDRTMKVWIDFKLQGTISSGGTGIYYVNIGSHTLQAGEDITEFNTVHEFGLDDPYTWTLSD
ncbi:hypothetical protein J7K50_07295 [bacterium]|nr:hypothetical protein [bacterium]